MKRMKRIEEAKGLALSISNPALENLATGRGEKRKKPRIRRIEEAKGLALSISSPAVNNLTMKGDQKRSVSNEAQYKKGSSF